MAANITINTMVPPLFVAPLITSPFTLAANPLVGPPKPAKPKPQIKHIAQSTIPTIACSKCGKSAFRGCLKEICQTYGCENYCATSPIARQRFSRPAKLIQKQKDATVRFLEMLRPHVTDAIVAGGAPRNWSFEKPAKDIDIYCFNFNNDAFRDNAKLDIQVKSKQGTNYSVNFCVFDVSFEGHIFQLIETQAFDLIRFVNTTFDFNINKVIFNGKEIYGLDGFESDRFNKTITCNLTTILQLLSSDKERVLKTLAKRSELMKSYFPKFQLRIT